MLEIAGSVREGEIAGSVTEGEIAGSMREGEWGAEGASIHLSQYIKGVLRRPLSRSQLVHR